MSDDRLALEMLRRVSDAGALHTIVHYVYLPSRAGAAEAAASLRSHGFATEEEPEAGGSDWLVLAQHEIVPSEAAIASARGVMERVAAEAGGEYDGWQAAVR